MIIQLATRKKNNNPRIHMEPFKYLTPAHPYLKIKNLNGSSSLELTKSKPSNCKVLSLLENIQSILKEDIRITNSREFSNLTRYDLCKKLRVIAKEIKVKYYHHIEKSSSFSMIFKTDLTERIEIKYAKIKKIVHTKTNTPKHDPSNFGLPLELIYKIFKYLNYNDVKSYSQVDRMAYEICHNPDSKDEFGTELEKRHLEQIGQNLMILFMKHPYKYKPISLYKFWKF